MVCSREDADAHIATGALTATTRITAFLPSGRKAMDARDLPQLPFAVSPPPSPVEPDAVAPGPMAAPMAPPVPPVPEPEIFRAPKPARKPPPVSAAFKKEVVNPRAGPAASRGPSATASPAGPAWLSGPVWMQPLHRYAEFQGRSSLQEYWSYMLLVWVGGFLGIAFLSAISDDLGDGALGLAVLALFIPNWAATVRRLHDINMSGWWILISIFPYVGQLVLFILLLLPGTNGPNSYGEPSPR